MFALSGINFHMTKCALKEIAAIASRRGTGARGLRSITENILVDSFFVTPSLPDCNVVYVDSMAVRGERQPILLRAGVTLEKFLEATGGAEVSDEDRDVELREGEVELVCVDDFMGVEFEGEGEREEEEEREEGAAA